MNKNGTLRLTQKIEYGLILLIALAEKNEDTKSIKKIASEKKLSFMFLQKIAGILKESKLIMADRGKFGGYKLAKNPKKLKLKEIIEVLEGPISIVPCLQQSCCKKKTCKVKSKLDILNKEIEKCFSSKTLEFFL